MRWLWQAIQHRWYMGYWPSRNTFDVDHAPESYVVVIDEYAMTKRQMDQYIDPVIQEGIDAFLADVLD
jgi:hypothetical protein